MTHSHRKRKKKEKRSNLALTVFWFLLGPMNNKYESRSWNTLAGSVVTPRLPYGSEYHWRFSVAAFKLEAIDGTSQCCKNTYQRKRACVFWTRVKYGQFCGSLHAQNTMSKAILLRYSLSYIVILLMINIVHPFFTNCSLRLLTPRNNMSVSSFS